MNNQLTIKSGSKKTTLKTGSILKILKSKKINLNNMKKLLIISTMLLIFNNMNAQTKTSDKNCASISGNYSGTSQMGNSNGTAKLLINSNCIATLTYPVIIPYLP